MTNTLKRRDLQEIHAEWVRFLSFCGGEDPCVAKPTREQANVYKEWLKSGGSPRKKFNPLLAVQYSREILKARSVMPTVQELKVIADKKKEDAKNSEEFAKLTAARLEREAAIAAADHRSILKEVKRALIKKGLALNHVSKSDGRVSSYYFDSPLGEIRISDHELPSQTFCGLSIARKNRVVDECVKNYANADEVVSAIMLVLG